MAGILAEILVPAANEAGKEEWIGRALGLLRKVEWNGGHCPDYHSHWRSGHSDDCRLDAFLKQERK